MDGASPPPLAVGLVGVVLESTKLGEWGGGGVGAQALGLAAVLAELCTIDIADELFLQDTQADICTSL